MRQFKLYPIVEYRSDDPDWIMWRVNHVDGKDYLIAYTGDKLKEVYFVGEGSAAYFMSCRADFSKISHYYVDSRYSVIRRYEDGVRNRVYYDDGKGGTVCSTHEYIQVRLTTEKVDFEKMFNDLEKFLKEFKKRGIAIAKPDYVI